MNQQRVFMSGQAGANPSARWEGQVVSPVFTVPEYGWLVDQECVAVSWDRWTGRGPYQSFCDIRRVVDLTKA